MKIKYYLTKYLKQIIIVAVVIMLLLLGIVVKDTSNPVYEKDHLELMTSKQIVVSIEGEVKFPNVYYIEENSKIEDLIMLAGGLTNDANISFINLKKELVDQDYIYIPKKGMEGIKVNINKATLKELQTLTGIGETKAYNIILYRTINGPFNKVDDLLKVEGITSKNLSDIINEITLS